MTTKEKRQEHSKGAISDKGKNITKELFEELKEIAIKKGLTISNFIEGQELEDEYETNYQAATEFMSATHFQRPQECLFYKDNKVEIREFEESDNGLYKSIFENGDYFILNTIHLLMITARDENVGVLETLIIDHLGLITTEEKVKQKQRDFYCEQVEIIEKIKRNKREFKEEYPLLTKHAWKVITETLLVYIRVAERNIRGYINTSEDDKHVYFSSYSNTVKYKERMLSVRTLQNHTQILTMLGLLNKKQEKMHELLKLEIERVERNFKGKNTLNINTYSHNEITKELLDKAEETLEEWIKAGYLMTEVTSTAIEKVFSREKVEGMYDVSELNFIRASQRKREEKNRIDQEYINDFFDKDNELPF